MKIRLVAVAAGLQFLSLNGWRAELDPPAAAAVVVEALACGQLSPAAAAEAAGRKPASVIYPQVLLYIQAGCWAAVSAVGLISFLVAMVNDDIPPGEGAELLGRRVHRTRSRGTRPAVIITELAMTCFGLLWLFIPAFGFIALGFSGACLSLAAVLCMTRPRARRYFNRPDPMPVSPGLGALSGPAAGPSHPWTEKLMTGEPHVKHARPRLAARIVCTAAPLVLAAGCVAAAGAQAPPQPDLSASQLAGPWVSPEGSGTITFYDDYTFTATRLDLNGLLGVKCWPAASASGPGCSRALTGARSKTSRNTLPETWFS